MNKSFLIIFHTINQLTHYWPASYVCGCLGEILVSILEGIIEKISYERHNYESVDEKSLS